MDQRKLSIQAGRSCGSCGNKEGRGLKKLSTCSPMPYVDDEEDEISGNLSPVGGILGLVLPFRALGIFFLYDLGSSMKNIYFLDQNRSLRMEKFVRGNYGSTNFVIFFFYFLCGCVYAFGFRPHHSRTDKKTRNICCRRQCAIFLLQKYFFFSYDKIKSPKKKPNFSISFMCSFVPFLKRNSASFPTKEKVILFEISGNFVHGIILYKFVLLLKKKYKCQNINGCCSSCMNIGHM